MRKLISIIVPIYNAEKYISRCFNSLISQTYKNFEVIAVNDGSTDRTFEILNQYEKKDQRIKVITKHNEGSASARNLALKYAKGDYIAFVDVDDYVSVNFLEILADIAEETEADIVECDYTIVYDEKELKERINKIEEPHLLTNIEKLEELCNKSTYLKSCVLWTKLYRSRLFQGLKFVENKGIDDEFIIHRLIYRANMVAVTEQKLYFYCMSDNSQMRSKPTIKKIDNTEALEDQLAFYQSIGNKKLYNMLLYRYLRTVNGNYRFLKENYSDKKELIIQLKKKRKKLYYALLVREIPLLDKMFLLLDRFAPCLAKNIHTYAEKKKKRNIE